jgi:hypothetical protein
MMAFVAINPRYARFLDAEGLREPEQFLALAGVIVCGHPDRHVAQVTLGEGGAAVPAYLKREHRVPLRDRLANAWAGLGFVSKSCREAQALEELRRAGLGCPEWIAVGEDDAGRAFLLTRELTGAAELRAFLRDHLPQSPTPRRRFAARLGETLANLHDAGFDHPDLHSKHILVDPEDDAIYLVDCQRTAWSPRLAWRRRWHNLAALDATLGEHLANPRDRLACLQAYLRSALPVRAPRAFVAEAVRCIRARVGRLLRRRHIREVRHARLTLGVQNLLWLDGEALCVTPAFHDACRGHLPAWLTPAQPRGGQRMTWNRVELPDGSKGELTRRERSRPLRWFWAWLRRRPFTSPELRQAGTLFRLQRHGVGVPRLLAVGQRHAPPWRTESFLLTETPPGAEDLAAWLRKRSGPECWTAERKQRWQAIREAAALVRAVHEAGCALRAAHCPLLVRREPWGKCALLLRSPEYVRTMRRAPRGQARQDLASLRRWFVPTACSRSDQLRFLLRYLGLPRLTPAAKELARAVLAGEGNRG